MWTRLTFAVGFAAGYAAGAGVGAGGGKQASAQLQGLMRSASRLPGPQHWAGRLSSAASVATDSARSTLRQAVATVSTSAGWHDAASDPAPSGGVIPLSAVPVDQLSEWELDLLTTPDSVQ